MDRRVFCDAYPAPESDHNHNMTLGKRLAGLLTQRNSSSSLYTDMNEKVVKAATYMKFLLKVCIVAIEQYFHLLHGVIIFTIGRLSMTSIGDYQPHTYVAFVLTPK